MVYRFCPVGVIDADIADEGVGFLGFERIIAKTDFYLVTADTISFFVIRDDYDPDGVNSRRTGIL